jgi:hypothetical protein
MQVKALPCSGKVTVLNELSPTRTLHPFWGNFRVRSSIRNAGNTVVFHSKFSTTMRSFSDIRKAYFVDQTGLTVHAWVSLRAVDTFHGCGGYCGSGAGTSAFTSVLW